jgi:hypothetical protein
MVRAGRGPFRPPRARRARAMHEIPPENLRKPARTRRVGTMRQFPTGQLDSSILIFLVIQLRPYLQPYFHRSARAHRENL